MPYKNPEARKAAQRRWREANREKVAESRQKFRLKQRAIIQAAKDTPCTDCGVEYPYYVMQLDHRDPAEKSFTIGHIEQVTPSMKRLHEEIAKCDPVCANCHAERTHRQRLSS